MISPSTSIARRCCNGSQAPSTLLLIRSSAVFPSSLIKRHVKLGSTRTLACVVGSGTVSLKDKTDMVWKVSPTLTMTTSRYGQIRQGSSDATSAVTATAAATASGTRMHVESTLFGDKRTSTRGAAGGLLAGLFAAGTCLLSASSGAADTTRSEAATHASTPLGHHTSSSSSSSPESSSGHHHEAPTPVNVGKESFMGDDYVENLDDLPVYRLSEVAENNGDDGKPVWMTYGGVVYDVTEFIQNHPGGSEKIMMAAGSAIEPYWHIYRQHYASDLPLRLMEKMIIGRLDEKEQEEIDEQMEKLVSESDDPYAKEPIRHKSLRVHSDTPMNAEVPSDLLAENYLTPAALFYIRHHHPVPYLTEKQIQKYKVKIDLSAYGKGVREISFKDIKKLPKVEVVATLQCSGNRRGNFNEFKRTSGTSWGQGAVSTAKWGGARLRDVLALAGVEDPVEAEEKGKMNHVRFESLDGMMASIGIEKAASPYGDVIVAYEMNGEPLPRDHGYPLRVIVPGYAAVRSVKWLSKIELAETEAEGPWQRGLNYKALPPSVTDARDVNLDKMPPMTEASLFSGITKIERVSPKSNSPEAGDKVILKASGWAWAGGGRNIVRVDVTGDGGKTWATADIVEGGDQKFGRAWAWVFWTCDVPATVGSDGRVEICSKAVDMAFNVQPEKCNHMWNVRGLGNNSWFRSHVRIQ